MLEGSRRLWWLAGAVGVTTGYLCNGRSLRQHKAGELPRPRIGFLDDQPVLTTTTAPIHPSMHANDDIRSSTVVPTVLANASQSPEDQRPHLVILGTGWAAVGVLQKLDPSMYRVTVLSPTTYFLFTPLLPSATVGTVEPTSLTEPIRKLLAKYGHTRNAAFIQGRAMDMSRYPASERLSGELLCQDRIGRPFRLGFDKLVIAVGSQSWSFGVPGVQENCHYLKTLKDVHCIRNALLKNFELAQLPTTSAEDRSRLLSFVICGGGPTGVEFAAELYDFVEDYVQRFYPQLQEDVGLHIIQSQDHILNTYDERISKMAEEAFTRDGFHVITRSRVTAVREGELDYMDAQQKTHTLPFGLCIWTTGLGMQSFTERLVNCISDQTHSRALKVDSHLRVKGIYQGASLADSTVWAIGDCSVMETPRLTNSLRNAFCDSDINQDGELSMEEFTMLAKKLAEAYPELAFHLAKLESMFRKYDVDGSGALSMPEVGRMLTDLDNKIKPLPVTAQVAQQEGKYVSDLLNWQRKRFSDDNTRPGFRYRHFGSMAYIGRDTATMDFGHGFVIGGQLGTIWLWRSVYLSEQVSLRQRINLALDWFKCWLFGRDLGGE